MLAAEAVSCLNRAMAALRDIWEEIGIPEELRLERTETVKKHIKVRGGGGSPVQPRPAPHSLAAGPAARSPPGRSSSPRSALSVPQGQAASAGQPGLAGPPGGVCLGPLSPPGPVLLGTLCWLPLPPALSALGPSGGAPAAVPPARSPLSLSIPAACVSNHSCAAESPGHDGVGGAEPEGASVEEHRHVSEGA